MRTLIVLPILIIASFLSLYCSHTPAFEIDDAVEDVTKLKYFKILACTDDDNVFIKVQDEMSIDPKMTIFILIVNTTNDNPDNHYIVFGEEDDKSSIRAGFNTLSDETKRKLLEWNEVNKFEIKPKKKHHKTNN
ncbi:MAG: hypothetical protein ACOYN6_00195 [Ignavibacteria bacterium]